MAFDGSFVPAARAAVLDRPDTQPAPAGAPPAPPVVTTTAALPPGSEGSVNWPECARLHTAPATIRQAVAVDLTHGKPGEWFYLADVPAAAGGELRLWPNEFRPARAKAPAPKMTITAAKESGYTGDPCTTCGSMRIVRSGSCAKCDECGNTSGCS